MTDDDLSSDETAAMNALEGGNWTPTRLLPDGALTSLTERGYIETSTWAEWARLTDTGAELFEIAS